MWKLKSALIPEGKRNKPPNVRALSHLIQNKLPLLLNNGVKITGRIGNKSANGAVFSTTNNKIVVKVTPYIRRNQVSNREYNIQKTLGALGIAPRMLNYKTVNVNNATLSKLFSNRTINANKLAVFKMNHLKQNANNSIISLANYLETRPGKRINLPTYKTIFGYVKQMQNLGISHSNLHFGNIYIILDSTGKIKDVKLIDFGRSKYLGARLRKQSRENYALRGAEGKFNNETKAFFSPGRTGRRSNMNMLYLLNKLYYKYLMNLNNEKEKMEKLKKKKKNAKS